MDKAICSIDGCDRHVRCRGWCDRHYWRWQKHGDPLAGGTGNGEPAAFVLTAMRVDSDECVLWPYGTAGHGYAVMYLDGKQTFVHRLVCELVNGAAPSLNHEAAHSCGNGHLACINKKHLRWATRAENHADKLIHGTANRGERHGLARLNEDAVRKIRSLAGTLSQQRIAREVGCSRSQVMRILSGECWGWLQ